MLGVMSTLRDVKWTNDPCSFLEWTPQGLSPPEQVGVAVKCSFGLELWGLRHVSLGP